MLSVLNMLQMAYDKRRPDRVASYILWTGVSCLVWCLRLVMMWWKDVAASVLLMHIYMCSVTHLTCETGWKINYLTLTCVSVLLLLLLYAFDQKIIFKLQPKSFWIVMIERNDSTRALVSYTVFPANQVRFMWSHHCSLMALKEPVRFQLDCTVLDGYAAAGLWIKKKTNVCKYVCLQVYDRVSKPAHFETLTAETRI